MNRISLSRGFWLPALLLVGLLLAGCMAVQPSAEDAAQPDASAPAAAGETVTMFVNSERVACTGVAPMMCLQVRESEDADWQFFYSGIDGFFFVPGYVYELVVLKTPVESPPADGSSIAWTLVEIVSKTPAYSGEPVAIVGTEWLLRSFGEESIVRYDETVTPVTLVLHEDLSVSGNAGCNNIIGGFTEGEGSITFGPLGTTMMMCDEAAMAVEQAFLAALDGTHAYQINGNMLEIVYAAGVLTFQAQSADGAAASAPADAAPAGDALPLVDTPWVLASLDEAMGAAFDPATTPVTINFVDDGSVSGVAGCNNFFGGYTDEGATIAFTPFGSTRKMCDEAAMAVESAIFGALQGSVEYAIDGSTLTMTTATGVLVFEAAEVEAKEGEAAEAAPAADALPLVDTTWTLQSFDESMGVTFDPAVTEVTAIFGADGSLAGGSGCNRYFGGYTLDGTIVTFDTLGGTMMMCEEGAMAVEQAFLAALQGSAEAQIEGSTLRLITESGPLVFTGTADQTNEAPAEEAAGAPLTGTEWKLMAFDESMAVTFDPAVTNVLLNFADDGSLFGKGGCNNFSGGYTIDGTIVSFGAIAATMMACPDPAASVESAFFAALQGDAQAQISGSTLELITGTGTLTFEAQ